MDITQRIVEQAHTLFLRQGVKSVTLDDIARNLGIAKKTIYQKVGNKAEIVHRVCKRHFEMEESFCWEVCEQAQNAIEELVAIITHSIQMFQTISPMLIYELQKYYPTSWQLFEDHKNKFLLKTIKDNLVRGQTEGYYRSTIDIEIVSRMRMGQIGLGFDSSLFPPRKFNYGRVQLQMMEMYMFGLVTEKGRQKLIEYLTKENYPV